jgi:hypothetical protein
MCTYDDDSENCKKLKINHGSHGYNAGLESPVAGEGIRFSSRLDSASVNQSSNTPVINYPDYSQIIRCLDSTDTKLIQDLVQVPVFSLDSDQVFQIQNTFGFIPLGELPVAAGPPGPTINVNVADYLRVINVYAGLPNYICKTAPVASHLNLNLLRYWAQGHHDLQVCDLLEFGFSLDLDRHKFISNSSWFS